MDTVGLYGRLSVWLTLWLATASEAKEAVEQSSAAIAQSGPVARAVSDTVFLKGRSMEILYLLAALVALALAWYLGRRSCKDHQQSGLPANYAAGINLAIDQQPDEALETFISSVGVNADTLETHFAIGQLMRQRGEVERAIKVHQNLLSRTVLTQQQLQQAQLELAKDFLKAGLLDRAERLLLELVESDGHFSYEAARHLMELYQDEHEWEKAIRAASYCRQGLFPASRDRLSVELCQFYCEQAFEAMGRQDWDKAVIPLKQAKKIRRNSVRVSLLTGKLSEKGGRYAEAIEHYARIPDQDRAMLPEALDSLARCYEQLDRQADFVELLGDWLIRFRDPRVLSYLAPRASADFQVDFKEMIADFLEQCPYAMGIRALLDIDAKTDDTDNDTYRRLQEQLKMIKSAVDKLIEETPGYHCDKCGFTGEQLHWLCPQCRSWETVKPTQAF